MVSSFYLLCTNLQTFYVTEDLLRSTACHKVTTRSLPHWDQEYVSFAAVDGRRVEVCFRSIFPLHLERCPFYCFLHPHLTPLIILIHYQ